MFRRFAIALGRCLSLVLVSAAAAQDLGDTRPIVGIRENVPPWHFLKDARVITAPGQTLESASVSIRGSSIVAVGQAIEAPAGAKIIDCSDKTIYAGFIDGYRELAVAEPTDDGAGHWNGYVLPRRATATAVHSVSDIATARTQGITLRLIAPEGGIVKGTSCLVALDGNNSVRMIDDDVAQHLQLTVPRDKRRDDYPNSPMGAIALLRQTLSDAQWYTQAWKAYQSKPELNRPTRNDDLARLAIDRDQGHFIVDAPNERMALRAAQIADEFSLQMTIRGSGREYRDLNAIANTGRAILLPIDFPAAPDVSSEAVADEVSLQELMHWHFAPENPARLAAAGVTFCLTTDGLKDQKSFLNNIRTAVERGLSTDAALAAITTTPAKLLNIDEVSGQIRPGSLANLVITDGDLFAKDTKVLETWVAGNRFEHDAASTPPPDAFEGTWQTVIRAGRVAVPIRVELKRDKTKWSGKVHGETSAPTESLSIKEGQQAENKTNESAGEQPSDEQDPKAKQTAVATLNKIARASDRFTAWVDLATADRRLPKGPSQITIVTVGDTESMQLFSTVTLADGTTQNLNWKRLQAETEITVQPKSDDKESSSEESTPAEASTDSKINPTNPLDEILVNAPLGGSGVTEPIPVADCVLFRGATVWTCNEQGAVDQMDVLVVAGKIESVGAALKAPADCQIIDAKGKHISPGLIDCHSHMATDGGVNESGQAVTAEVRVGDFIDNSDITIYRQLAGGLTTANILHGSANPIGGQNQVIKLRWGDGMEAMKLAGAPTGIKFALGENVKRSNRSEPQTRYPASRMGVEQLFRDRFLAAQEYDLAQRRWATGNRDALPPRRDLELETLAEILNHQRWIHCHSYRQDEIVALLDLLDSFEIKIGTLQHILEGYKVADRMLQHGAMASAFSDWWAYKFEVYDAIPDNGAIMHDVGIVVSFNSDDRELARHMNTEAAKAVKYGGVAPAEALKFVTLNPAKQLRIDNRIGSIEPGKDADIVVWSGPPLSTLSRCEQTWVDGRMMFSRDQDQSYRQRDARWRSLLIAKILDKNADSSSGDDKTVSEEDRWLRYDEFCHGHDHNDEHRNNEHAGHSH